MRHAQLVILGSCLLASCDPNAEFEPLVVDSSPNCAKAAIEPLVENLDADPRWSRVLAAAHEAPRSDAYWLLVEVESDAGEPQLAVAFVAPDGQTIGTRVVGDVNLGRAELRAGPNPGEAWLIDAGVGTFSLWRFEVEGDRVRSTRSADLGGFPFTDDRCRDENDDQVRCDVGAWPRALAFLSGQPFVVSVPPFSPDAKTDIWLGQLSEQGLGLVEERELEFAPMCDPALPQHLYEACLSDTSALQITDVALVAAQRTTQPNTWSGVLLRTKTLSEGDVDFAAQDVVIVSLGFDPIRGPAGALRSQQESSGSATFTDEQARTLVVDDFAFYWISKNVRGAWLSRYSLLSVLFAPIIAVDDTNPTFDLLQLEDDVAIGWIDGDGAWQVLKLFPAAARLSQQTAYEAATPIADVHPAGDGVFLLERTSGGPDLVRVRCDAN